MPRYACATEAGCGRPSKRKKRCTALGPRSVQRLAECTLHIQDVVAIEFDIEKVERIPTVRRLEDDAGPINQVADFHQETINVDGMQSREAKICGRRVLTQSTAPYENRQSSTGCRPICPTRCSRCD